MKKYLLLLFLAISSVVSAKTYYVAPTGGSDYNIGTNINAPWATWQKAFNTSVAGDTVYFRGGVWYPSKDNYGNVTEIYPSIGRGHNGTYAEPICYFNYPGETPVLDCSLVHPTVNGNVGLSITNATYLKFKGLTIRNNRMWTSTMTTHGVLATDYHNLYFENIAVHNIGGPGFTFGAYDTTYVVNCDAYNCIDTLNADPGGRADGFFANCGAINLKAYTHIFGCRAWNCSDDGFDISASTRVRISNCWAFDLGKLKGEGNGFKFAWSRVHEADIIKVTNSIAANNVRQGFYYTNLEYADYGSFYNNTVYKCMSGFANVQYVSGNPGGVTYRNNISYNNSWDWFEQTYFMGDIYIQDHNTWIPTKGIWPYWAYNPAVTVTEADFVSLDASQLSRPRKSDGSLPDITFLKLVSGSDLINAGIDVGLPFSGSAPDIGAFESTGNDPNFKPVSSITVTGAGGVATITADDGTLQLIAAVLPADATNKTVTWSITSGTDKAKISATGLVTAIDNGTAVARALANDGSGVSGYLTITISNQVQSVTSITVTGAGGATTITADNGTLQLSAAVLPANATNKTVTWSITNGTDKATISSTGLITALDNGTVIARATAKDGSGVYGTVNITILNQIIPVTSITVAGDGGAMTITIDNGTLQLIASILPSNATNKALTWSITSGADKASINSTGLVTGLDNGTATARATANDGSGIYGILTITITNQIVPLTSISVTGAGGATLITNLGGTLQLTAVVLPANATNRTVTWSITSGTDKASINSTGLVTAVDNGTATVRAAANDGSGVYGTLTITISNQVIPVTGITVTGAGGATSITTNNGALQLSAAILPANATNKVVTWSITSGTDKASINSTGQVVALDNGTATVRAAANDGSGVYGTLVITVSNQTIPVTSIALTGAGGVTAITTDNGTLQISANVLPANATNRAVTWSITSGTDKASINSTGLVVALDNGTATARATANDGSGIYGTLLITISNQIIIVNTPPVIVVNFQSNSYSGFVYDLDASGSYDSNKDNLTFTWQTPSNIAVSSTTGPRIKYLGPMVSTVQTCEFILNVSDGKTTQSKFIPIKLIPYKPELESAEISNIEASSFLAPYFPYNVIDGNIGTMWSANGEDQWIIAELKHSFSINHVKIAFEPGQKMESYFDVLGSVDKISWETILTKSTSCAFSGDLQVFEFPPSKTGKEFNYIKLIGLGNSKDLWNYISELKVFGYKHRTSSANEKLPVKVYPNPAKEFISIRIEEPSLVPDLFQITGISGNVFINIEVDPDIREFTIPISLKKGIYILQLRTGNIILFAQKLVIN